MRFAQDGDLDFRRNRCRLVPLAYSLMDFSLRSAVIDIGFSIQKVSSRAPERARPRFETGLKATEPAFRTWAQTMFAGGEPPNTVAVESVEKSKPVGPDRRRIAFGGPTRPVPGCRPAAVSIGKNVLKSGGTMAQRPSGGSSEIAPSSLKGPTRIRPQGTDHAARSRARARDVPR